MPNVLGNLGNALGLDPAILDGELIAGEDMVAGSLAQLDYPAADSQSTVGTPAARNSEGSVAVLPTAAGANGGIPIAIAVTAAFAGRRFRSRFMGLASVLIFGEYTRGSVVVTNEPESAAGKRILGYLMETGGTAGAFSYATVWWNGVEGWGQVIATTGNEPEPPEVVIIEDPWEQSPGGLPPGSGPVPEDAEWTAGLQPIVVVDL